MCQSDSTSRENDHCNHTLFVIGNPMRLQFQSRRCKWRAGKIVWRACELNVFMFPPLPLPSTLMAGLILSGVFTVKFRLNFAVLSETVWNLTALPAYAVFLCAAPSCLQLSSLTGLLWVRSKVPLFDISSLRGFFLWEGINLLTEKASVFGK